MHNIFLPHLISQIYVIGCPSLMNQSLRQNEGGYTTSRNQVSYPNLWTYVFYCQYEGERVKAYSRPPKLTAIRIYFRKDVLILKNDLWGMPIPLHLFVVYCIKHSSGIFSVPGKVLAPENHEINKMQVQPGQLVFQSFPFTLLVSFVKAFTAPISSVHLSCSRQ